MARVVVGPEAELDGDEDGGVDEEDAADAQHDCPTGGGREWC